MKSTRKEATNQRIERITIKHAVVGIDIAKDAHAAQVTDFRGRTLTSRHLSFTNTLEGFKGHASQTSITFAYCGARANWTLLVQPRELVDSARGRGGASQPGYDAPQHRMSCSKF